MPHAELRVPPPSAVLPSIVYSLVLVFVVVAICNLLYANRIPATAVVASILWLGIVFLFVSSSLRCEGGIRKFVVNRLGTYSRYHFVRATPATGKADSISIGYSLFGRDQSFLHVKVDAISSLEWCAGQGTAMGGRDMNDWSVALWYHHPEGPQRRPFPGAREEEVFIIGPSGPKATVETFGLQLVEFLIGVGVELKPGKDNCEYVTHSRRTAISEFHDPER